MGNTLKVHYCTALGTNQIHAASHYFCIASYTDRQTDRQTCFRIKLVAQSHMDRCVTRHQSPRHKMTAVARILIGTIILQVDSNGTLRLFLDAVQKPMKLLFRHDVLTGITFGLKQYSLWATLRISF